MWISLSWWGWEKNWAETPAYLGGSWSLFLSLLTARSREASFVNPRLLPQGCFSNTGCITGWWFHPHRGSGRQLWLPLWEFLCAILALVSFLGEQNQYNVYMYIYWCFTHAHTAKLLYLSHQLKSAFLGFQEQLEVWFGTFTQPPSDLPLCSSPFPFPDNYHSTCKLSFWVLWIGDDMRSSHSRFF